MVTNGAAVLFQPPVAGQQVTPRSLPVVVVVLEVVMVRHAIHIEVGHGDAKCVRRKQWTARDADAANP